MREYAWFGIFLGLLAAVLLASNDNSSAFRPDWYDDSTHIALDSPVDADNIVLGKLRDTITIVDVHCIVDPADSTESVVIDIQERDSSGDSPASFDTTITCDNDGAEDDGSLSNPTFDAGDWWGIDIGTVTGTVTWLTVSIYFTIDRE